MKLQLLPNKFKKLGLLLFTIGVIPLFYEGFVTGWNDNICEFDSNNPTLQTLSGNVGISIFHLLEILAVIGPIIYLLSKEKIEDDYINKLRLESYQSTVLIILFIYLCIYIFLGDIKVSIDYFMSPFLLIYLLIFWYKKREF